mgnify:CR=1 FL=1
MRLPAPLLGGGPRLSSLSLSAAATDDTAATNSVLATALPMLGACIAEPTLSWIDSICVARFAASPSVGLAALSVDSAIFNMLACCTSFLCTATTNIVGSQADDDEHVSVAAADVLEGLYHDYKRSQGVPEGVIQIKKTAIQDAGGDAPLAERMVR